MRIAGAACIVALICGTAYAKNAFTIYDAINQAVRTNPAVGEATANRRATEADQHQSQGVLLPQVRLQLDAGPEKLYRAITPAPVNNGNWQNGREGSVVVRQLLFDGLASINQIWQQAARVDAASSRVLERTELTALDAAEAYIDVNRYLRLAKLASDNLAAHRRIQSNVRARFKGGRAGEGDLQQAVEREQSAEATLADYKNRLDDARAAYRKTVGLEPYNVQFPSRLRGLPATKDEALEIALKYNPTIRAAQFDAKAAKYSFEATGGTFLPNVYLEGRALRGWDSTTYDGRRDEASAKIIASWDIFTGGQDSWKRAGAAERMTEQAMRHARLQREAFQTLDKAWSARTVTSERVTALTRELAASRRVVTAYAKEYEIGQRTLVDLLNAENQQFNVASSLVSAQGVAVFADYQLLAVMGQMLNYLKTPHPIEASHQPEPIGIFPLKFAPILLHAPDVGSEPIKFSGSNANGANASYAQAHTKDATFADRFTAIFRPDAAATKVTAAETRSETAPVAVQSEPAATVAQQVMSQRTLSFVPSGLSNGSMAASMLRQMPMWPSRLAN